MTTEETQYLWHIFNRFQKTREVKYTPKINTALKSQVNQFVTAKRNGSGDAQALDKVTAFDLWVTLKPLYLDAGITYGAKVVASIRKQKARMPIGFNELMVQLIEQYFQIELLNNVEDITHTTRDFIRNVMIEAYKEGLSFDDIVKQLESPELTAKRARLIARTETVTASNTGAMLAAKSTGLNMNKVWISAQDNRTRRTPRDHFDHLHMNGVTIHADSMFDVSGESMAFPGDRKTGATAGNICNCRCTHGYIPIREKAFVPVDYTPHFEKAEKEIEVLQKSVSAQTQEIIKSNTTQVDVFTDVLKKTIEAIPAPVVEVKAPVVNIPEPVVNVAAPIVHVTEQVVDQSEVINFIRAGMDIVAQAGMRIIDGQNEIIKLQKEIMKPKPKKRWEFDTVIVDGRIKKVIANEI